MLHLFKIFHRYTGSYENLSYVRIQKRWDNAGWQCSCWLALQPRWDSYVREWKLAWRHLDSYPSWPEVESWRPSIREGVFSVPSQDRPNRAWIWISAANVLRTATGLPSIKISARCMSGPWSVRGENFYHDLGDFC